MAVLIKSRYRFVSKPITQARLKELLRYDPATGEWTRIRGSRGCRAGEKVGYILPAGHRVLSVDGHDYRATHLAFLFMEGKWPDDQVDHKNCVPQDDRWDNLRQATEAQNRHNTKRQRNNSTGYKGVSPMKGKYRATISFNYKQIHLGLFATPEDAHAAYAMKAHEIFGEFARTE